VAHAFSNESARLLSTIAGIGALNATALTAAIGNAQTFGRGRDLAAWLGLVPRQVTTGGKPKLLGINKRGNGYLRKMLIHGARRRCRSAPEAKYDAVQTATAEVDQQTGREPRSPSTGSTETT
jgi:transposase